MKLMNVFAKSVLITFVATAVQIASAQQTIKIGVINPFSGPLALYGGEMTRGFELAADKVNASGGPIGRKIEIIQIDASNPQQGIAALARGFKNV